MSVFSSHTPRTEAVLDFAGKGQNVPDRDVPVGGIIKLTSAELYSPFGEETIGLPGWEEVVMPWSRMMGLSFWALLPLWGNCTFLLGFIIAGRLSELEQAASNVANWEILGLDFDDNRRQQTGVIGKRESSGEQRKSRVVCRTEYLRAKEPL